MRLSGCVDGPSIINGGASIKLYNEDVNISKSSLYISFVM